jgi:hypothetical protein
MTKPAIKPSTVRPQSRPAISLEAAAALCPDEQLADRIADTFGLDQVASTEIRLRTRAHLIEMAQMLQDHLNEKALALHLQRVVAGFVGSAFGAGQFYDTKVGQARQLSSRLHSEHRDEDRDGIVGFDSRAQRAREFAAEVALQAHAVLAAAEGAADAYAHLVGEAWRPYARAPLPAESVGRQAAAAQLAAFQR